VAGSGRFEGIDDADPSPPDVGNVPGNERPVPHGGGGREQAVDNWEGTGNRQARPCLRDRAINWVCPPLFAAATIALDPHAT
jgi:hypothetical protein